MLGMLINTSLPWAPNAWKAWVDHIMRQKGALEFRQAALLHDNGTTASATRGFVLRPSEIQKLSQYFAGKQDGDQRVTIQGKTCIVKSATECQLVAFRGNKYYIICKSKSMYIAALCESRAKADEAANWLRKLNSKLIEKDF